MQLWEEMAYAREEAIEEGRAEGLEIGLEEGRAEGLEIGLAEGKSKKLINIVCRMLQKDNTPEIIADNLEESIDYIKEIDRAAQECGYDCDKIYERLTAI